MVTWHDKVQKLQGATMHLTKSSKCTKRNLRSTFRHDIDKDRSCFISRPYYHPPMGCAHRFAAAVSLWCNAYHRRAEILSECIFYGIGMCVIGLLFTILVATGTFPAPISVLQASSLLAIYIDMYLLFAIAGGCAFLAGRNARARLRAGKGTTMAKLVLAFGLLCLVVSIVLAVVAVVKSASPAPAHHTPVWMYVTHALVLFLRLMFLSVLVMAIFTLLEADSKAEVRDVVAGVAYNLPVYGEQACASGHVGSSKSTSAPMSSEAVAVAVPAPQPASDGPSYAYPPQPLQQATPGCSTAPAGTECLHLQAVLAQPAPAVCADHGKRRFWTHYLGFKSVGDRDANRELRRMSGGW